MRDRRVDASALLIGIGALLLAIFFLLPWIAASGVNLAAGSIMVETGSGFDLAKEGLLAEGDAFYLWLIPVAAALGLAWAIYVGYQGFTDLVSSIVGSGIVFLALLALGIFLGKWVTSDTIQEVKDLANLVGTDFKLSYGLWGALVAALAMLTGDLIAFAAMGGQTGGFPSYPGPTVPMPAAPPPPAPPRPVAPPPTMQAPPRPAPHAQPRHEPTDIIGGGAQPVGWLVARSGSRSGQSYGLTQGNNTVGRDASRADIVLDDPTVSGEHARLRFEGGQFYIYDLASSNGTFVNNRRVQRQMLMDNDVVRFGNAELVFKKV